MKKKDEEKKSGGTVYFMSMGEFKAWLDGFSECFKNGAPNKAQWNRIAERLATVSIQQEVVYRDRPYWWPNWYTYTWPINNGGIVWNSNSIGGGGTLQTVTIGDTVGQTSDNISVAINAATEIGKTEALEFTN